MYIAEIPCIVESGIKHNNPNHKLIYIIVINKNFFDYQILKIGLDIYRILMT
jgi:hypothetical protein